MIFDGTLLRDLIVQTPVVAILIIILILDRRDHAKAMKEVRESNEKLEQALIDHMNRLAE